MTWWESLIVHAFPSILHELLKDPAKKALAKHVSLDVYTAIKEAYADDPDFTNAA